MMRKWMRTLVVLVLAVAMTAGITAVSVPETAQAAAKTITVKTQAKLNKALKNKKYTKITIANTKDANFQIAKGKYAAQIVLSAKKGYTVSLDIAKGAQITKGVNVKGTGADIQVNSAAKVQITAQSPAIIRLEKGAEGSTIVEKADDVYVGNYTSGTVNVTGTNGKTKKVEAFADVKDDIVIYCMAGGGTLWVEYCDTLSTSMYAKSIFTIDGKRLEPDRTKSNRFLYIVDLKKRLTAGAHTFTIEAPNYKKYTKTVYNADVEKKFVNGVRVRSSELVLELYGEMANKKVTYRIDDEEVKATKTEKGNDLNTLEVTIPYQFTWTSGTASEHLLTVSAEGYEDFTWMFGGLMDSSPQMVFNYMSFTVNILAKEIVYTIDGVEITPEVSIPDSPNNKIIHVSDLAEGRHTLTLRSNGYTDQSCDFYVDPYGNIEPML